MDRVHTSVLSKLQWISRLSVFRLTLQDTCAAWLLTAESRIDTRLARTGRYKLGLLRIYIALIERRSCAGRLEDRSEFSNPLSSGKGNLYTIQKGWPVKIAPSIHRIKADDLEVTRYEHRNSPRISSHIPHTPGLIAAGRPTRIAVIRLQTSQDHGIYIACSE